MSGQFSLAEFSTNLPEGPSPSG